jgi:hypothetical protein
MPENYILLERTELNASAASVTFANIPQTGYTDLKIVVSARGTTSGAYYYYAYPNGATTNLTGKYLYNADPNPLSGSGVAFGYMPPSTYTANTFSNDEIYFPNYLSGNFKSYSHDSISENNTSSPAPAWRNALAAGLWSQTTAISSVTITSAADSFAANSTFSLYGIAALGTTPTIAPKASGGNRIDYDGTYWIHTFLTSGTFTPQVGLTCDYLVVAGGGGGGKGPGGGGGAGGYRAGSSFSVASLTNFNIIVGAGGTGAVASTSTATDGSLSTFSTISSTGGGGGGRSHNSANGRTGGSGGGGATPNGTGGSGNAGSYSPVEGYAGGNESTSGDGGGGGGGSSAVGGTGSGGNGFAGGAGTASSITGSSVTRAGGGGGGGQTSFSGGSGGSGGGGAGGNGGTTATGAAGVVGTVNTGSGGGGGGQGSTTDGNGANGGSGIVIIRYPAA